MNLMEMKYLTSKGTSSYVEFRKQQTSTIDQKLQHHSLIGNRAFQQTPNPGNIQTVDRFQLHMQNRQHKIKKQATTTQNTKGTGHANSCI